MKNRGRTADLMVMFGGSGDENITSSIMEDDFIQPL